MAELEALERYLHEHIPMSIHLGIQVLEADPARVRLGAPLVPNLNHERTAFGGSLSAVAILSCWSLLWVRLHEVTPGHRIVIHSNTVSYLAPTRSDFEALCLAPTAETWERFRHTLTQRGRARLDLQAEVRTDTAVVATFQGRYVAFVPDAEPGH